MKAVDLIIEDSYRLFEHSKFDDTLNELLPVLSQVLQAEPQHSAKARSHAISAVNFLILSSNQIIYDATGGYLDLLIGQISTLDDY